MEVYIGKIYTTNKSGNLEILKYINSREVKVRFVATGYETTARMGDIRKGRVKDYLYPSLCGVGFIGDGVYVAKVKGEQTKAYQCWNDMLKRCYSEVRQKINPTYIGCTVCNDWLNFQVFAEWYYNNYPNDGGKYDLDKDIKIDGNKVYSPETCLFVSHFENTMKASAKSFTFKNPEGEVIKVYNLRQFCKENNLDQGAMCNVNSGKANQHKGWTSSGVNLEETGKVK